MTRHLLTVALRLALTLGWRGVTHADIALASGAPLAVVTEKLGTLEQLRRSLMRAAVKERYVSIVAEGLAAKDRHAMRADESLRDLCSAWVNEGRKKCS